MTPAALEAGLSVRRAAVDEALERILPEEDARPRGLASAMRYATLAGGKRLRPILALAVFETIGPSPAPKDVVEAAAALELVHTYSLIHDDLPCMDDDSLRRGKPTCHVVYGEATALLAGDTLQSLAFEVLATRPRGDAAAGRRADACAILARAIGLDGMAGGQALDLAAAGTASPDAAPASVVEIHRKKTGRLLGASAEIGAVLAGADRAAREAAAWFGDALGLVFQIADDLLDVTADTARLGKTAGKDEAQAKLTFPAVFGLDGTRAELRRAVEAARAAAASVEGPSGSLAALARWAADRDR